MHILDYKPDARTNKPIAQLAIYALALTRLVPGLKLFDIKCAWFNEEEYCEFFPTLAVRPHPSASKGVEPNAVVAGAEFSDPALKPRHLPHRVKLARECMFAQRLHTNVGAPLPIATVQFRQTYGVIGVCRFRLFAEVINDAAYARRVQP